MKNHTKLSIAIIGVGLAIGGYFAVKEVQYRLALKYLHDKGVWLGDDKGKGWAKKTIVNKAHALKIGADTYLDAKGNKYDSKTDAKVK